MDVESVQEFMGLDKSKPMERIETPKPIHEHDCTCCRFLFSVLEKDVYLCGDPLKKYRASVIVRRSSDGPDYWSMDYTSLYTNEYDVRSVDHAIAVVGAQKVGVEPR